jgi:hypothetical protein
MKSCVQVAQACNPSFSGGRDQEGLGSKPAWTNSSRDSISKKTLHKKGLVEWLKVYALSSNPITSKKKKKKPNEIAVLRCLHALKMNNFRLQDDNI